jgi:hypothetical protein
MSGIDLIWLVDADPPSDGSGRGVYPAGPSTDPPDEALMRRRFAAIRDVVQGEAGGDAVLTVHTSPRFRSTFFREPYAGILRDIAACGVVLALHPHEDRADGGSHYDDAAHLERVIAHAVKASREAGLPLRGFRSGGFAFHPRLPRLLASHGIALDLSAAPGLFDPDRNAVWSEDAWRQEWVLGDTEARVASVPIGWDGAGSRLDRNYLYNEKHNLASLRRVWDALLADPGRPRAVNFLTHGFGLVEPSWRRQAVDFLRHVRSSGARVVSARAIAPDMPPATQGKQ